ncbi:ATP-dependent Clp protease proteolytic subunit [Paenibacillus filicis]|uniref:ATP-dependent Clp protease proteolytic subunit n=1 Tax=Paenibacillus gyeongsangnamensis TaxID=3388067 RepID=A0ABT4Q2V3_9BACL|nr:NfeD family protein [Paenibacillus filicis]MCZ8511171.1 ATP-dependent Clp protease proteolytic subunit [Paenibacillus filicis]
MTHIARRRFYAWLVLGLALLLLIVPAAASVSAEGAPAGGAPAKSAPVVVIPVHQTIESGLQQYMERAFRDAQDMRAVAIILDINTLGGRVDSAEGIGELIRGSKIPTVAYVHGKAASAGSYIALNAGKIVMEPGSSIGAAAVVDAAGNEVQSAKVVAHWSSEMKAAAELRGRNPQIAEAMVDKNAGASLPQLGRELEKGKILSLTAEEALKVGYAEKVTGNLQEVVALSGGEGHPVVSLNPTPAENFSRFITQPWVSTLLLLIGIAGVAIELFVPGFGLPGILGLLGFGLYFFGHYIAGFAGAEEFILFAGGVVLLLIEVFVSSFGILGILGAICLFSSVIMAAYNTAQAALNLGIAFVLALIVVIVVVRIFKHRGVWNRFILKDRLTTDKGYSSAEERKELLGQQGTSLTPLRPAGTASFGERRVDVVTAGDFVAAGQPVEVIHIEGYRVVVKEVKKV